MNRYNKVVSGGLIVTLLLAAMVYLKVEAAVPPDFQTEQLIGSGLDAPSGFDIAPDGRVFILERDGTVKIYKNGNLLPTPFAVLPSETTGDRGLIGIAFDPDYLTNYRVYFYYTGLDDFNHLVRFDGSEDVGTNGPVPIYTTNQPSQLLHVGGTIRFGPDGKLYVGIGDNGYAANAQNLDNPFGKVLRLNKDGSIPSDNPFVGQAGHLPEIWAYGLRNPFRFQFDPAEGYLYLGDVGSNSWEEVNLIVRGGNYGWPLAEGVCAPCDFIDPIHAYPHIDGASHSIAGGPVYRGNMFPQEYRGNLFFGDYAAGFIQRMTFDANGDVANVIDFDTQAGSVVDMKVAPDGSLYYITYYPGRLYRVSYSTVSHGPTANATADVTSGMGPLTVNFSSLGTSDPDEDELSYLWDFGDGTTSTEINPVKVYASDGAYTVDLTVSDGVNTSHAIPIIIQVGIPPTIEIASPLDSSTYHAGDEIFYTASGRDGAGRDLPDAAFTTEVKFHHATHFHPFIGPLPSNQSGVFTIPTVGESSANTWYEVIVSAKDENGLTATKSVLIYPVKSNITITTDPPNLTFFLDGVPHHASFTTEGVVGYERELSTLSSQKFDLVQYHFDHWSDDGAQTHFIQTPETDTTYTAHFIQAPSYSADYYGNQNLTGEPIFSRDYDEVDFNWGHLSPDLSVPNDHFSARYTKTEHFPTGNYRFSMTSDDGVRLYIDSELVIDRWVDQGSTTNTVDKFLSNGNHEVVLEYYENDGGAMVKLDFTQVSQTPPPPPPPIVGFDAEYWNAGTGSNPAIPITPANVTRTDAQINFDWGQSSPHSSINPNHFIARWSKTQSFTAGTYDFTVKADDGVRLFIDDTLVIDKWIDQGPTTYTSAQTLTAGNHSIRMEYYENAGGAVAQLNWQSSTTPPPPTPTPSPTPVPPPALPYNGEYWNTPAAGSAPIIPGTTPNLTRTDAQIDFNWGNLSPDASINDDHFVTRWSKNETFNEGTYRFTTTSDDGIRVFLDNVPVINEWNDQGSTTYTADVNVSAGEHNLRVEYYENAGGAVATFGFAQITTPVPPPTDHFLSEYWNAGTGSEPAMPITAPTFTKTDTQIDFNWEYGSPDPVINVDHFIARWTKAQSFTAGTYDFTVKADDGVRLFIDDTLIIDKWIDQGPTTYTSTQTLTAGNHSIRMEYYENAGGAVAQLNWQSSTTPPPPTPSPTPVPPPSVNDFAAQYWNAGTGSKPSMPLTAPTLTRTDAKINFIWNSLSPDPVINVNHFIARWTRQKNYAAGNYTFRLRTDDGARLIIDGVVVINDWNDHALTVNQVSINLTAGPHTVVIEYYENSGGAVAVFEETMN